MTPPLRRRAAVLLVVLFAHLALMASPLHAAEVLPGHGPSHVAVAGHAEPAARCVAGCLEADGLASAGAAEDCALAPAPAPRPTAPPVPVFRLAMPGWAPDPAPPARPVGLFGGAARASPAAARALLQVFRN